jgi:hypothetical protein
MNTNGFIILAGLASVFASLCTTPVAANDVQSLDVFVERLLHGDLSNSSGFVPGRIVIELPPNDPNFDAKLRAGFDAVDRAVAKMPAIVFPSEVTNPK